MIASHVHYFGREDGISYPEAFLQSASETRGNDTGHAGGKNPQLRQLEKPVEGVHRAFCTGARFDYEDRRAGPTDERRGERRSAESRVWPERPQERTRLAR